MISQKALDYIHLLESQPLFNAYRACDMGCFDFGKGIPRKNHKGQIITVSSLSIHIMCPFRVVSSDEKILFASYDIYLSHEGIRMDGMTWDKPGSNLFDKQCASWKQKNPSLTAESISLNQLGDLKLIFSNQDRLEIFVNESAAMNSEESECWRFFERNTETPHLVIGGCGDIW